MRHFKQRESFMNMNNGFSSEYRYLHKMQSLVIFLTAQAEALASVSG